MPSLKCSWDRVGQLGWDNTGPARWPAHARPEASQNSLQGHSLDISYCCASVLGNLESRAARFHSGSLVRVAVNPPARGQGQVGSAVSKKYLHNKPDDGHCSNELIDHLCSLLICWLSVSIHQYARTNQPSSPPAADSSEDCNLRLFL